MMKRFRIFVEGDADKKFLSEIPKRFQLSTVFLFVNINVNKK